MVSETCLGHFGVCWVLVRHHHEPYGDKVRQTETLNGRPRLEVTASVVLSHLDGALHDRREYMYPLPAGAGVLGSRSGQASHVVLKLGTLSLGADVDQSLDLLDHRVHAHDRAPRAPVDECCQCPDLELSPAPYVDELPLQLSRHQSTHPSACAIKRGTEKTEAASHLLLYQF